MGDLVECLYIIHTADHLHEENLVRIVVYFFVERHQVIAKEYKWFKVGQQRRNLLKMVKCSSGKSYVVNKLAADTLPINVSLRMDLG